MREVVTPVEVPRRLAISGVLLSLARLFCPRCALFAAQRARERDDAPIEFKAEALKQLLHWAQSNVVTDPPEWRHHLPYELAREQAKWSGRASPDLAVEKQLLLIREQKRKGRGASFVADTANFVERIMQRRDEFLRWAVPHLRAYLPAGTPIRGAVALAAFLPNYAFSMNDTIVISATDRFWGNDPNRLFNMLVHELFHNGFIQHQRGESPNDAIEGTALLRTLLWSVQNEGLATYVAYRVKPAELVLNDYRLLENQAEVRTRFELCRGLIEDLQCSTKQALASLKERLWQEGDIRRVSYIGGATMAQRIEQVDGRPKLLVTIENGPHAFLQAYRGTSPSAEFAL